MGELIVLTQYSGRIRRGMMNWHTIELGSNISGVASGKKGGIGTSNRDGILIESIIILLCEKTQLDGALFERTDLIYPFKY